MVIVDLLKHGLDVGHLHDVAQLFEVVHLPVVVHLHWYDIVHHVVFTLGPAILEIRSLSNSQGFLAEYTSQVCNHHTQLESHQLSHKMKSLFQLF